MTFGIGQPARPIHRRVGPRRLWTPGSFHGSVGHGEDAVERFIKSQEDL